MQRLRAANALIGTKLPKKLLETVLRQRQTLADVRAGIKAAARGVLDPEITESSSTQVRPVGTPEKIEREESGKWSL